MPREVRRDGVVVQFPDSATQEQIDRWFQSRREKAAQAAQFKQQAPQQQVPQIPSVRQPRVAAPVIPSPGMARPEYQDEDRQLVGDYTNAPGGALSPDYVAAINPMIVASKDAYRRMREDLLQRSAEASEPEGIAKKLKEMVYNVGVQYKSGREKYDPFFSKTLLKQADQYSEDAWNRKYGAITPQSMQEMQDEIGAIESGLNAGLMEGSENLAKAMAPFRGASETGANVILGAADLATQPFTPDSTDGFVPRLDLSAGARAAMAKPDVSTGEKIAEQVLYGLGAASAPLGVGSKVGAALKAAKFGNAAIRAAQVGTAATMGGLGARRGDRLASAATSAASMAIGMGAEKVLGRMLTNIPKNAKLVAIPIVGGGGGNIAGELIVDITTGRPVDPASLVTSGLLGTVFSYQSVRRSLSDSDVRSLDEARNAAEEEVQKIQPLDQREVDAYQARRQSTIEQMPDEIEGLVGLGIDEDSAIDIAQKIANVRAQNNPRAAKQMMAEISAEISAKIGGSRASAAADKAVSEFNSGDLPPDILSKLKSVVTGRKPAAPAAEPAKTGEKPAGKPADGKRGRGAGRPAAQPEPTATPAEMRIRIKRRIKELEQVYDEDDPNASRGEETFPNEYDILKSELARIESEMRGAPAQRPVAGKPQSGPTAGPTAVPTVPPTKTPVTPTTGPAKAKAAATAPPVKPANIPVVEPVKPVAAPVAEPAKPSATKAKGPTISAEQKKAALAQLTPNQLSLYNWIVNFKSKNRRSPKGTEIASELGITKQAAYKTLNRLIELGLISKKGPSSHGYRVVAEGEVAAADGARAPSKIIAPEADESTSNIQPPPPEWGTAPANKRAAPTGKRVVPEEASAAAPPPPEVEAPAPRPKIVPGRDAFDAFTEILNAPDAAAAGKVKNGDLALDVAMRFGGKRFKSKLESALKNPKYSGMSDGEIVRTVFDSMNSDVRQSAAQFINARLRKLEKLKKIKPESTRKFKGSGIGREDAKNLGVQRESLPGYQQYFDDYRSQGASVNDARRTAGIRALIDDLGRRLESETDRVSRLKMVRKVGRLNAELKQAEIRMTGRALPPNETVKQIRSEAEADYEAEGAARENLRLKSRTPEQIAEDQAQRQKQLDEDRPAPERKMKISAVRVFDDLISQGGTPKPEVVERVAEMLEATGSAKGKGLAKLVREGYLVYYFKTARKARGVSADQDAQVDREIAAARQVFERADMVESGEFSESSLIDKRLTRLRVRAEALRRSEDPKKIEEANRLQKEIDALAEEYDRALMSELPRRSVSEISDKSEVSRNIRDLGQFETDVSSKSSESGVKRGYQVFKPNAPTSERKGASRIKFEDIKSERGTPQYAADVEAAVKSEVRSIASGEFDLEQIDAIAAYEGARAVVEEMPPKIKGTPDNLKLVLAYKNRLSQARKVLDNERINPKVPDAWKKRSYRPARSGGGLQREGYERPSTGGGVKPAGGEDGKKPRSGGGASAGPDGEITYYGSGISPESIKPIAKETVRQLRPLVVDPFMSLYEAVGRSGGEVGARLRRKLMDVAGAVRKYEGRLAVSYRALKKASADLGFWESAPVVGRIGKRSVAAREMSEVSRVEGENYAKMPIIVDAVEGRYSGELSSQQQAIVDAAREMSGTALDLAAEVGVLRYNTRTKKYQPINRSGERRGFLWRRMPTRYMTEIMLRGKEHPDWSTLVDSFHKENPRLSLETVEKMLLANSGQMRSLRAAPGEKQAAFEFFRQFKNAPAALYTGVRGAVNTPKLLFEVEPGKWADAMSRSTAQRLAMIEVFGQNIVYDPKTMKKIEGMSPIDAERAEYRDAGGNLGVLDEALDAAEGRAVDIPKQRSIQIAKIAADGVSKIINGPIKTAKLSASWIYNSIEPFGSTREQSGIGSTLEAYGDALSSGLYELTGGKFGSADKAAIFESLTQEGAIGVGRLSSQRFVEGVAARAMQLSVNKMRARAGKPGLESEIDKDTVRLRRMGYTLDEARSLASGEASDLDYDNLIRKAAPSATGGRMTGPELTRVEHSSLFKDAFPIARYAFRQFGQLVRTARLATDAIGPMNRAEASKAVSAIADTVGTRAASGVAQGVLFAAFMGGTVGLRAALSRLREDPAGTVLNGAATSFFSGPFSGITQQIVRENGNIFDAVFPLVVLKEASNLLNNEGRYKDLDIADKFEEASRWLLPGVKAIGGATELVGSMLGSEDTEFQTRQAGREFNRWFRDNKISRSSGFILNPGERAEARSAAMRRFRRAVMDRNPDAVISTLEEAFNAKSGGDLNKAILSDRFLSGLSKEGLKDKEVIASLRRTIGDENYKILVAHDKMLEVLAAQFAAKRNRPLTVFPKGGVGRAVRQQLR